MPKDKPRIRQDTPQDSSVDNLRSRSTGVKVGSKLGQRHAQVGMESGYARHKASV